MQSTAGGKPEPLVVCGLQYTAPRRRGWTDQTVVHPFSSERGRMAFSNVSAVLTNSSVVTVTIPTTDYAASRVYVQNVVQNGGFWGNDRNYYPIGGVLSLTVS
jgi:hypothetical protein